MSWINPPCIISLRASGRIQPAPCWRKREEMTLCYALAGRSRRRIIKWSVEQKEWDCRVTKEQLVVPRIEIWVLSYYALIWFASQKVQREFCQFSRQYSSNNKMAFLTMVSLFCLIFIFTLLRWTSYRDVFLHWKRRRQTGKQSTNPQGNVYWLFPCSNRSLSLYWSSAHADFYLCTVVFIRQSMLSHADWLIAWIYRSYRSATRLHTSWIYWMNAITQRNEAWMSILFLSLSLSLSLSADEYSRRERERWWE